MYSPKPEDALLPCPFCGQDGELGYNKKDGTEGHAWCSNDECEADIWGATATEAAKRWNRRVK